MKKRFKGLGFVGLFLLYMNMAYGQKYNIKTYSVNDGLPSSQIYDVHLDSEGLVWFATAYGLVKFDGYQFVTYDKRHGLRDEFMKDIFEDSQSRFWVSTLVGGVGEFITDSVYHPKEFSRLDTMLVNIIAESPLTNDLWFGTNSDGIYKWDGRELTTLSIEDGVPDEIIWDIWFDDDDKTWITTENGIATYEEGKGITKSWNKEDGLSGNAVYQIFEASDGTLWLPTDNGITLIKDDKISTITDINGEKLDYVYSITEDDEGIIWIGTYRNGLYWYDGEEFTHITKKNGLSSNYVFRLVKAEDGTIWVATNGNGVSIFRDRQFKFYDNSLDLGSNSVFSLLIDEEGTLWIGIEDGITSFKNGQFKNYSIPEDLFTGEEIWAIEQLPNGNLLLLTYDYKLIEFDGEKFFSSDMNEALSECFIMDFIIDGNSIWIADSEGLIKYENGEYQEFRPGGGQIWQTFVNMIFKDSSGNIWLGTNEGAAKYDGNNFIFYTEKDGLNGQNIYGIEEDSKGSIWIGTNRGISVLKNANHSEKPITIEAFENEDAFLSETISLLVDNKGGVWQGTNAGLNYYDAESWYATGNMKTLHFPLDNFGNGIEFNGLASTIDEEGTLWFGTMEKGLLQYDASLNSRPKVSPPPHTYIRKVYANGEVVFDQETSNSTTQIDLGNNQNNLEIDFGAVNYKDPYRIFYRFKLEGFDEEWITGLDQRRAYYTNLDPGEYKFLVMSKSSTSDWPETASTIDIEIEGPFWQTAWFLFLAIATLVGLIAMYINIHLNIVEKKKLKLLVDDKTKDLTKALCEKEVLIKEIHHRVKNNMAVISGLLELQSWQMEDGGAKNAIEDSKLRIKTMSTIHEKLYKSNDLSRVNFKEFAQDLIKNVSNSLKGIDKDVKVSMDIDVEQLDVNKAIPCGLMLNELLSNSYEHAFAESNTGNVEISFKEHGNYFVFKVSDDGIGIPENVINNERSSLGITLIHSLSRQLDATLEVDCTNGTTVSMKIPKLEM